MIILQKNGEILLRFPRLFLSQINDNKSEVNMNKVYLTEKEPIYIKLADMKFIDSCTGILQNSDLGKAYFSDHEKAADMLTYAVRQKKRICCIG